MMSGSISNNEFIFTETTTKKNRRRNDEKYRQSIWNLLIFYEMLLFLLTYTPVNRYTFLSFFHRVILHSCWMMEFRHICFIYSGSKSLWAFKDVLRNFDSLPNIIIIIIIGSIYQGKHYKNRQFFFLFFCSFWLHNEVIPWNELMQCF